MPVWLDVEGKLRAGLWEAYGLDVAHVQRLALGADVNAAVFRVTTDDGAADLGRAAAPTGPERRPPDRLLGE